MLCGLAVCIQDNSASYKRILMKFSEVVDRQNVNWHFAASLDKLWTYFDEMLLRMDSGPRTNQSDVGRDPVQDADAGFLNPQQGERQKTSRTASSTTCRTHVRKKPKLENTSHQCRHIMRPSAYSCTASTLTFDILNRKLTHKLLLAWERSHRFCFFSAPFCLRVRNA